MLLDPGSQSNFITEKLANSLKLKKIPFRCSISGVGNNVTLNSKYKMSIEIQSKICDYSKNICCLVLTQITQQMPSYSLEPQGIKIPKDKFLSDPKFYESAEIDILCGVGLFYDILRMNQFKLSNGLILQDTKLGWVLGGEVNLFTNSLDSKVSSFHCVLSEDMQELNDNLNKFWQIEECTVREIKEDFCENHFLNNYYRDNKGQFVVRIPFKNTISDLGKSKNMALRRFYQLEKRLARNENVKEQYIKFMTEYEKLGHMKELDCDVNDLADEKDMYYLPHQEVIKSSSLTTPCRVVFDFSAGTDNNVSFNDVHFSGPVIQEELLDILLRFRLHRYVMAADISKMYRCVWINPDETRFQRIFWRNSQQEKLRCYELLTVTYGMGASSYLSTRSLVELAIKHEKNYPKARNSIRDNFFVDDYLEGHDDKDELIKLQKEVTEILESGGFRLRKWLTNEQKLFDEFNIDRNIEASILNLSGEENSKILGITWNANSDQIEFDSDKIENNTITKRSILSTISQLFDPMGLVGPVVIRAKFILQLLWKEKTKWDEPVSEVICQKWLNFTEDLHLLKMIKIPRHIALTKADNYDLHTFVDASEKGYGACVYLSCERDKEFSSRLIVAKSKVAPIKQITLPRLELCAAVLGSKLADRVKKALKIQFREVYYWTDSLVTYHWIRGSPDRWKTFVANRVSAIQSKTSIDNWYRVKSGDNPADLMSRGTTVAQLINNDFWFQGPSWLRSDYSNWISNKNVSNLDTIPDEKTNSHLAMTNAESKFDIFDKFSSLPKLKRITAYCLRFIHNLRNRENRRSENLSVDEVNNAFMVLLKISQAESFRVEIKSLKEDGLADNSSRISNLRPFLDENSLIRVGGRISKGDLSFDKKHPIILAKGHVLTTLIMKNEHEELFHCGPQQLLYSVREKFWPISGRDIARKIAHKCVICFKARPKPTEYIMGNLPKERITQCFPFSSVGCDYAGPFHLKDRKTRKPQLTKAWVCIFVCMVTKAVHIELVTDLTSLSFLACFRRFISRRGKPSVIFSDNGTQFVDANNEILNFIKTNKNSISKFFTDQGITWKFIPARAPNFGGVWESGIKSIKHHLKRVIGNYHLHFDEFNTILCQIEAVLNSRPLTPLSSSPDDFSPLTPSHFLIGHALTTIPEPNFVPIPDNRLNAYQCRQKIVQLFWQRWSKEYIGELQTRLKWTKNYPQLVKMDSLVVVKDDNLPPLLWKMAKIVALHPGDDKVIRVASVRFSDGSVVKRSVRKLCVLPLDNENE